MMHTKQDMKKTFNADTVLALTKDRGGNEQMDTKLGYIDDRKPLSTLSKTLNVGQMELRILQLEDEVDEAYDMGYTEGYQQCVDDVNTNLNNYNNKVIIMSKEKTVHIVCVLDRSGSMSNIATEVIGAYNNFIDEQRKVEGKAKVTLVLFDDQYEVAYKKVPLEEVQELTQKTYFTRGMTAMHDALGKTIQSFRKKDKVIFLVQTDGYENASREYDANSVKTLIEKKTKKGWDFNFLGADIDSVMVGGSLGIARGKSANFDKSASGVLNAYDSFSSSTVMYRGAVKLESETEPTTETV